MRTLLVYPLAAGLGIALAAAAPARAITDLERLEQLEQDVAVLKRKLEVQQEDATTKAASTPVVGAGADGFFLRSPDSKFQFKLRGYTQLDSRWLLEPGEGGDDTFVFRRVRPIFEGTLYDTVDFRIMPDFANSTLTLFDAYVNLRYFPQAQLEAGKFKPPVGLERLQSATATMFIERAFPTLLVPSRDLGAMLWSELAEGLVTYQVGFFNGVRDGGTQDVDTDDGKDVAARLFFHPFRPLKNEWLDNLGVGISGTWGSVDDQTPAAFKTTASSSNFFTYRDKIAAVTGPPPVPAFSAVSGDGDRVRFSPQAYWYVGPFGLLAEYVSSKQGVLQATTTATGGSNRANLTHSAWQVAASYLLTGENASYKGVVPSSPFAPSKRTWGAFEIAARYNEIDFDDDSFPTYADPAASATRAQGFTVGANWYLNRWVRLMVDYDRTWFDGGAAGATPGSIADRDTEDSIFTRLQLSY